MRPLGAGQRDANVLHHALIFVVENMAVEHEVADVAAIRVRTIAVYIPAGCSSLGRCSASRS